MALTKIILGSNSPYRKELLQRLNLSFTVESPTVDEEALKKQASVSSIDLPLYLAQKKAESLIRKNSSALIIGCDQMGFCEGMTLNKAGTRERAIEQLMSIQGKTHSLVSAVAVYYQNQWELFTDTTLLTMRSLSEKEIKNYVDLESPLDCAGSYKIEGLGISLFETVDCHDPTSIIGLPLMKLITAFKKFGISII